MEATMPTYSTVVGLVSPVGAAVAVSGEPAGSPPVDVVATAGAALVAAATVAGVVGAVVGAGAVVEVGAVSGFVFFAPGVSQEMIRRPSRTSTLVA